MGEELLCRNCGATIEENDQSYRHVRSLAESCDLDDDASLNAIPREIS